MDVPSKYKTGGTLMMIAGIFNLISGIVVAVILFLNITMFAAFTMGLGIVCYACCLWPIVPLAWGVFELVIGLRIMGGKPAPQGPMVAMVGIIMGALNLLFGVGMIPMVLEIIAFIMLNDPESKQYIESQQADLLA